MPDPIAPASAPVAVETSTPHRGEWVISAGGAITSGLTIALLMWVYNVFDTDLSSFSVWVMLPIGAIGAGMAVASGYYFAAKWTHTMPSKRLLIDSVLIAAAAWFLLHWLKYISLTFPDGTRVADGVDFWTYFRTVTEHSSLQISARPGSSSFTTGELGGLGYVRQFLQFAGFALGGLAMYGLLVTSPVCKSCRKYLKQQMIGKSMSPAAFDELMRQTNVTLPNLRQNVIDALGSRSLRSIGLEQQMCPKCSAVHVAPLIWIGKDDEPTRLAAYAIEAELLAELRAAAEVEAKANK